MTAPSRPTRFRARCGFTLLEVIVVVAILAILAALAAPRFAGATRREFTLAVEKVQDLLTMFAQRDSLSPKPVGISFDAQRGWLYLVVLDTDDWRFSTTADWQPDPYVRPVKLPGVVNTATLAVYADGESIDISEYPLANSPGEPRPRIELSFQSIDGLHTASLTLAPHAVAPSLLDSELVTVERVPVDLDAAGRSREEW
jgi:prepilin-type N-terminal cleavage/methylation domain-containing protein